MRSVAEEGLRQGERPGRWRATGLSRLLPDAKNPTLTRRIDTRALSEGPRFMRNPRSSSDPVPLGWHPVALTTLMRLASSAKSSNSQRNTSLPNGQIRRRSSVGTTTVTRKMFISLATLSE